MTQKSPKELGTEKISKLLMMYAIPAVIAMTASSLYNMVDRIFIGRIGSGAEGALALSGLAVTFPIMNLSAAFGAMIGVGGSTLISVKLGQRDYATAQNVLGNVVSLNVLIGVVLGFVAILFIDPILLFFGASENTIGYARDYMFIILLGNVITHLYLGLNSALRATGHPNIAMYATITTVVVNSVLDPLFIFTLNLGIRGAAYATVIAQFIALIFVLKILSNKNEVIHLRRGIYKLKKRIVKNMLTIGLSPFCMQLCACLVVILINKGLQKHGGDLSIAAFGIINGITFIFVMICMGITQGMQPIAGFNYGAQKFDRVTLVLKYSILYASVVMTCSFVVCEFFPHIPVMLFTEDPNLTALATAGMKIIVLCNPLIGFYIVVGNFFQSIGMAKRSIFLSASRQLLFLVPLLITLPDIFGTNGVWISIAISDGIAIIVASLMLWNFYKHGAFKNTELDL
ncbi:MAG: MATE family efflux transporter [Bacteroides sp.]|nr:MATE family efflux transporter [Roseburia sp.]MCM1346845.1 MATE family efflux transporter [Bacteroides sp.]MCM1419939.1 MATE family efflux transporter [Bacteroides sp.]